MSDYHTYGKHDKYESTPPKLIEKMLTELDKPPRCDVEMDRLRIPSIDFTVQGTILDVNRDIKEIPPKHYHAPV